MSNPPLFLTTDDHARLRLLANTPTSSRSASLEQLRSELDRATLLDPKAVPPNVVRMGSRVEIEDLGTGEVDEYTLVYPERADVERRQLSVLAPIGTAVIGFAEGAEVDWKTPGGNRRIRIRRVAPPEAPETPAGITLPLALNRTP